MHSSLTRIAAAAALLLAPSIASAQNHVYNFNNSLADLYNGPSLVANGGSLGPSGYSFAANQGLSLSNVFATAGDYSVAIRFDYSSLGGYQKILDFKDRTSDNGAYAYNSIADFYPAAVGGAYANGVTNMTVFTRDATTKLFTSYIDGVAAYSFYDNGDLGDFSAANNIAWFFRDDCGTCGEAGPGFVDYIATYDRALSATEVANLQVVTATPEPASMALLGTGLVGMFGIVRRRRVRA